MCLYRCIGSECHPVPNKLLLPHPPNAVMCDRKMVFIVHNVSLVIQLDRSHHYIDWIWEFDTQVGKEFLICDTLSSFGNDHNPFDY